MAIRLLLKTSERVRVVSPYDPAAGEFKDRLLADDLDVLQGVSIPDATWFELRGLSAGEIRRLRPLLPQPPEDVRAWLSAVAAGEAAPESPTLDRNFSAWQAEMGYVYLRACLESVSGLDGWPSSREQFLGLNLWPECATDSLPSDTGRWLGTLAYRLSMLPPEKKSHSGSPPVEPNGTTAESPKTTNEGNG